VLAIDRPIAFAHRGGAHLAPENTMEAFRNAYRLGCRFMETDCHVTRDGRVVLFHDDTLDRTTDGTGPVSARTLAELETLDAGQGFGGRFRGARIPTLEALAALAPDVRINVEIKHRTRAAVEVVLDEISRLGLEERILVASEDHETMTVIREISRGSLATSASKSEIVRFVIAAKIGRVRPVEFDALQVPVTHKHIRIVDRAFVQAAHACGVQVHVWTVDDPPAIRDLVQHFDVDGIMSDRPDLLTAVFGRA
jgi:glycerophosphoryl diester phosphodiesterase